MHVSYLSLSCAYLNGAARQDQSIACFHLWVCECMWYVHVHVHTWYVDIEAFTLIHISKINLNLKVVPGMILINKFIG